MKKKFFGLAILLIQMLVPVQAATVDVLLGEIHNDPRYVTTQDFLFDLGYALDEADAMVKQTDSGKAILIIVNDNMGGNVGNFSASNGSWKMSLVFSQEIRTYNIVQGDNGVATIVQQNERSSSKNPSSKPGARNNPQTASMTGNNWCMYTSKLGVTYACWSPSDNPFGYYFVVTYRVGDPISRYHYAWRADYRGRGIACPLNERSGSPQNWVQCGFPPD